MDLIANDSLREIISLLPCSSALLFSLTCHRVRRLFTTPPQPCPGRLEATYDAAIDPHRFSIAFLEECLIFGWINLIKWAESECKLCLADFLAPTENENEWTFLRSRLINAALTSDSIDVYNFLKDSCNLKIPIDDVLRSGCLLLARELATKDPFIGDSIETLLPGYIALGDPTLVKYILSKARLPSSSHIQVPGIMRAAGETGDLKMINLIRSAFPTSALRRTILLHTE